MVKDVRKCVLLAKIESTYDVDPTPTQSSNALLAQEVEIKEITQAVERPVQWLSLDRFPSVLGEQSVEVSFKLALIGSGTAGTAPRCGALLQACAHSETVSGGVSVTYKPTSSSHKSVTLYIYKDGRLHIVTGCRGNVKFVYAAGQIIMGEFSFMGRYAAPTNVSFPAPGDVTYETTVKVPPVCKSSTLAYNNKTTLVVGNVEFDAGNVTVKRSSLNDSNAIAGFEIVDRKPVLSIDPEAQYETSFDFRGDRLSTQRAFSVVATRAAGNIITLNVPKMNITGIEYGERDSILVEKLTAEATFDSQGDDAYSVVFT